MFTAAAERGSSTDYPQRIDKYALVATFSLLYVLRRLATVTVLKIKSNSCKTNSDTKIAWISTEGG
jgi:hypothetical protein